LKPADKKKVSRKSKNFKETVRQISCAQQRTNDLIAMQGEAKAKPSAGADDDDEAKDAGGVAAPAVPALPKDNGREREKSDKKEKKSKKPKE
jgi:hypothetical protein